MLKLYLFLTLLQTEQNFSSKQYTGRDIFVILAVVQCKTFSYWFFIDQSNVNV